MRSLKIKRLVVKVGSNVVSGKNGTDIAKIREICKEALDFAEQVIIVSSGAISNGKTLLGISPSNIVEQQACAAVGQVSLAHHYASVLGELGRVAAQVLLTEKDFIDAESEKNVLQCVEFLLSKGAVPIINENDVVSVAELEQREGIFGDNDVLSALVSTKLSADLLLLLSDVDGILDEFGRTIPLIRSYQLKNISTKKLVGNGRGGLKTKLEATKACVDSGVPVFIANGKKDNAVKNAITGGSEITRVLP